MGLLKNPTFTTWVIVILVILNLLTLGALFKYNVRAQLWGEKSPRHTQIDRNRDRDPITTIFSKRLNFTESQQAELKQLRDAHRVSMRAVDEALEQKRKQLFAMHRAENIDTESKDLLIREISVLFAEKENLTFGHLSDMRAICTPEQKPEFDKIIERMGKRRRGSGSDGERGRDRRRGPPPNRGGGN